MEMEMFYRMSLATVLFFLSFSDVIFGWTDERLRTAVQVLRAQERNRGATQIIFTYETDRNKFSQDNGTSKSRVRYNYTFLGKKQKQEWQMSLGLNETPVESQHVFAFNGEKHFSHEPLLKRGGMQSNGTTPGTYEDFVYLRRESFADYLEENLARALVEESGGALRLSWTENEKLRVEVDLDPTAGYQPRRVLKRGRMDPPQRLNATIPPVTESRHEVTVQDYSRTGEFVFPSKARKTLDYVTTTGDVVRYLKMELSVEQIHTNLKLPSDFFEIRFPEGTSVLDRDSGVVYVVGQVNSSRRIEDIAQTGKVTGTFWSSISLTRVLLLVGGLMFAVVLWIKWRDSRSS